MKYLDSQNDNWKDVDGDLKKKIENILIGLLKTKNLNVLSGLGTSLTVNDENDSNLAPKMSDLWSSIKDSVDSFEETKNKVNHPANNKDIEAFLSRCQQYQNLHQDSDVDSFIEKAEKKILEECDFLKEDLDLESHSQFLRKIAQRSSKLERTKIFTTNYDECFERSASQNRFHIIDGFSYLQPRTFDASYFDYDLIEKKGDNTKILIPQVFHLYKLHGSINWKKKGGQIIQSKKEELEPCLIYPQSTKYELSYQQPYLEIMSRFQIALRKPNTALLIIGFGFNDNHLAEPIINALRSNVRMKVFIVDPFLEEKIDKGENDYLMKLKKLIENNDSRISFLEAKFDELVKLIPDIAHASEKDRVIENLKSILNQES